MKCMTALQNFVEPLKVVVESEKRSKSSCNLSGNTLNKTLNGLLRILENRIKDIDNYVSVMIRMLRYKLSILPGLIIVPGDINRIFKYGLELAINLLYYLVIERKKY